MEAYVSEMEEKNNQMKERQREMERQVAGLRDGCKNADQNNEKYKSELADQKR